MLTPSVEPSGAAFATTSVPILPLAPGLFSTTNALTGYSCCRPSATRRATMSGVDPGPKGTTNRTVFAGQVLRHARILGWARQEQNRHEWRHFRRKR